MISNVIRYLMNVLDGFPFIQHLNLHTYVHTYIGCHTAPSNKST